MSSRNKRKNAEYSVEKALHDRQILSDWNADLNDQSLARTENSIPRSFTLSEIQPQTSFTLRRANHILG
jgi:hypothetical protein